MDLDEQIFQDILYDEEHFFDEKYNKISNKLKKCCDKCIATSQSFKGIPSPTGSHYYASVLFTILCVRSKSLIQLLPQRKSDNWDQAGVACLLRSILDARLCFFYLGIDTVCSDEWEVRWNVMNLHDCSRRKKLFGDDNDPRWNEQIEEIKQRLNGNAFFNKMPPKQQTRFLSGRENFIYSLEDISEKAGMNKEDFNWLYRLLSNQSHVYPLSFYRAGDTNRGAGVYSTIELKYLKLYIDRTIKILKKSQSEMKKKFHSVKPSIGNLP